MADSIDEGDAINYAAQFYADIANGQSINASFALTVGPAPRQPHRML